MKIVKEHIEFKQGENPYKSLKVGQHKSIEIGDVFELQKTLYNTDGGTIDWKIADSEYEKKLPNIIPMHSPIVWKGTILKVIDIWPMHDNQDRIVLGKNGEKECVIYHKFIIKHKDLFIRKSKKIIEHIEFKRGGNPYHKINIGNKVLNIKKSKIWWGYYWNMDIKVDKEGWSNFNFEDLETIINILINQSLPPYIKIDLTPYYNIKKYKKEIDSKIAPKLIKKHLRSINESQFIQNDNPYKSMTIGAYRKTKIGDKFKVLKNLYYDGDDLYKWIEVPNKKPQLGGIDKNEELIIVKPSNKTDGLTDFLVRIFDINKKFNGDIWWDKNHFENNIGILIKRI